MPMLSIIISTLISLVPINLKNTFIFSYHQNPNLGPLEFMIKFNRDTSATNPIVRLHNKDGGFFCTAIVVDIYHALTAAHCVTEFAGNVMPEDITVKSNNNQFITYAQAEGADAYKDSAIIRGDFRSVRSAHADLLGQYQPVIGSIVKACGYPSGQYELYCVEATIIGNVGFHIKAKGLPLIKGMSGGPVIYNGVVIGVNSAVTDDGIAIGTIVGLHVMAVR